MTTVVYLENGLCPQNRQVMQVAPTSIRALAPDWQIPFVAFVDGQPVQVGIAASAIDRARQRHGKPFAHEQGSDFRPHEIPVLTRWMQNGGANKERK